MCLCVLFSSTMLIMRDGERKVLTADNIFYNTLSARQALRQHCCWSRRRSSTRRSYRRLATTTSMTSTSLTYVSGTDLLPLPATNLHCINMHRCRQAGSSMTMPNTLRGMYLLTAALRGIQVRSNCHPLWWRSPGWFPDQPAGFSSQRHYSSTSRYSISLSHNQPLQYFGFFFR